MKILALIPARMGSSRFPGKPMAKINGTPMIQIIHQEIMKSKVVTSTYVATCDQVIFDHVNTTGGKAIMTSDKHERASDRCAEALIKIEKIEKTKFDIVVMIQGDEPTINHNMIEEAVKPLDIKKNILITNLMGNIDDLDEFNDPDCIKVVSDLESNAIYMSRQPLPTITIENKIKLYKQVCVIPFIRDFLLKYNEMEPTPLEKAESIDMLRVIENGFKLRMVKTNYKSYAVDRKEDILKVEKFLYSTKND